MESKADVWFEGFARGNESLIDWEEFSQSICRRFGNKKDVVEEFNKLLQDRGVKEYVERFEELKSLMNSLNPSLPESYYVSSFISGLREDINPMLKILRPTTLMQAFEQTKWQEESNNAMDKRSLFSPRTALLGSMDRQADS